MGGPGTDYNVVIYPDLPKPDKDHDPVDQYDVMVQAANDRGGLRRGEDLTAVPAGHDPLPGWQYEKTVKSGISGKAYDVYTRPPAADADTSSPGTEPSSTVEFSDDEGLVVTPRKKSDPEFGKPPGGEALKDIDENFSPDAGPTDTTLKCVAEFAEGFVEGAVIGFAVGFVLGLLGPVGVAIGVGMMLYGAYELATNWEHMSPEEKSRAIGGIAGGLVGGGLGGKQGARFRGSRTGGGGEVPVEELPPAQPQDPPGTFRDSNGRLRGPDGKFTRDPNAPPRPHSRDSEYPSGYRQGTHDEMAARWTDEGRAQGGVPRDANGNKIPHDQLTWRNAKGQRIPYRDAKGNTNLTYDHQPAVVEHWEEGGNNMSRGDRANWYNDPKNLTPQTRSQNSSEGATIGKTYGQETGPDYSE